MSVAVVLVTLAFPHIKAQVAAISGLVAALLVAIFIFGMPGGGVVLRPASPDRNHAG